MSTSVSNPEAVTPEMKDRLAEAMFEASKGKGYFKDVAGFRQHIEAWSEEEVKDLYAAYVRIGKILGIEVGNPKTPNQKAGGLVIVEPVGTCYEDAWRFLIKEEEGELIHGTVESLGRRIGHAWVELPTGFIWEPESNL